jgi:CRISPR-associated protein Cmr4
LFTEEFLPSESILYSLVLASPIFQPKEKKDKSIFHQTDNKDKPEEISVMDFFEMGLKSVIQVGGNATLGKGIVRTKILNANSKSEVAK